MIVNIFQRLLDELGVLIGCKLKADSFYRCAVLFNGEVEVKMQLVDKNKLLIASKLVDLQSGKHLADVLKESLKANGNPSNNCFLGYSKKKGSLFLFNKLDIDKIDGQRLFEFLIPFVRRAKNWQQSLLGANIPKEYEEAPVEQPNGFFGIH